MYCYYGFCFKASSCALMSLIFCCWIARRLSNSFCCCSLNGTTGKFSPAIRLSILAIMPSASVMSASVCLISSLSKGGSGLGKPGGRRGSLLAVSLLTWFELLFELLLGLNGSWVWLVLACVLVLVLLLGVTCAWLSTEVFVLDVVITETLDWVS